MAENNCCQWKGFLRAKCKRPLYDEKYCIFHSEDIEGKAKEFDVAFEAEFERRKKDEEEYDFQGFVFPGNISFRREVFEKGAYFMFSQFSGEADFSEAQFCRGANFLGAHFSGDAHFQKAQFSGEAYFNLARFSKKADFRKAIFSWKADFKDIWLKDPNQLDMEDAYLNDVEGLFEYIEENRKKFKYPDKTEFLPEGIWPKLGEDARDHYPIISRKIQDDKYIIAFKKRHPKLHFLWWLFADCGRSIARWATWSLGIAIFFAVLFLLIGPEQFKPKPEGYSWFSFFYYSIVTFTTLGFGDITPISWCTEILVTIEVILGYIMLGGLISILANKLARRS